MMVGMWGASLGILLTLVAAVVLLVALIRLGIFPPKEVPFYFFIPLKAKQFSENWDLVCRNLERTIANLLAQSDPNFSIIVVCNDLPSFLARRQRRIEVVTIESRIQSAKQSMGDRYYKRLAAGAYLKAKGVEHCYFMPVDADDLVHRHLVRHVHATDNRAGYIITKGYFLDVGNLKIARKNASFNHWCGTCAVFYFKARDFPSSVEDRQPYFSRLKNHVQFVEAAREAGHTLEPFDFHAAIYMVNHGENDQRLKGKNDSKVRFVQRHCFGGLSKIHSLAEAFPACSP